MNEFESLIGEWHGEGEIPIEPPMRISAEVKIDRLGEFIVLPRRASRPRCPTPSRSSVARPTASRSRCTISIRGVKRLYMTTVEGATWRIWCAPDGDWNGPDGPGFNQRFIGEISADGRSIDGRWERGLGEAGDRWELDFPIGYSASNERPPRPHTGSTASTGGSPADGRLRPAAAAARHVHHLSLVRGAQLFPGREPGQGAGGPDDRNADPRAIPAATPLARSWRSGRSPSASVSSPVAGCAPPAAAVRPNVGPSPRSSCSRLRRSSFSRSPPRSSASTSSITS